MVSLIAIEKGYDGKKVIYPGEPVNLTLEEDEDGNPILPSWCVSAGDYTEEGTAEVETHPLLDQNAATVNKAIRDGSFDESVLNELVAAEEARDNPRASVLKSLEEKR